MNDNLKAIIAYSPKLDELKQEIVKLVESEASAEEIVNKNEEYRKEVMRLKDVYGEKKEEVIAEVTEEKLKEESKKKNK
jgi:hypothetical protein